MKKKYILLATTGLLIASMLTACGSKDKNSKEDKTTIVVETETTTKKEKVTTEKETTTEQETTTVAETTTTEQPTTTEPPTTTPAPTTEQPTSEPTTPAPTTTQQVTQKPTEEATTANPAEPQKTKLGEWDSQSREYWNNRVMNDWSNDEELYALAKEYVAWCEKYYGVSFDKAVQPYEDQINAIRKSAGTPAIEIDKYACYVAIMRDMEMFKYSYFEHRRWDGRGASALDVYEIRTNNDVGGMNFSPAGECLAKSADPIEAWRKSDGHYKIMVSDDGTIAGLSCIYTGGFGVDVLQMAEMRYNADDWSSEH